MASKLTPSAEQKRWIEIVAEWGADNCGDVYGMHFQNQNIQMHHVCGRSYKQDKVSIGHWFVLPIPFELHDVSSNHEYNVTHHRHSFTAVYGMQRELFSFMVDAIYQRHKVKPPECVLSAISRTKY